MTFILLLIGEIHVNILVLFWGVGAGLRVGLLLSGFISSHNFFTLLSGFGTFEGSLLSVVYDS